LGIKCGSKVLADTIKRLKPRYVIYGHIHEGYGVTRDLNTTYINASSCNLRYSPVNPPIVFDLWLSNKNNQQSTISSGRPEGVRKQQDGSSDNAVGKSGLLSMSSPPSRAAGSPSSLLMRKSTGTIANASSLDKKKSDRQLFLDRKEQMLQRARQKYLEKL